ncbi:MAG TPA: hypothetical protein VMH22_14310 [bacterium]|nr:hypothetical protein [bacterium]
MKKLYAGLAAVLVSLATVGVSHAGSTFYGVTNPNGHTLIVDSALVKVGSKLDTFLTPGWGIGSGNDTFHFPDVPSWPDTITLYGTIDAQPNASPFPAPKADTWYRFMWPQITAPLAMFYGTTGIEEPITVVEPLQRLVVIPTVVTTQMAVRLQPAGSGRPIVEVLDAAGRLIRSLNCATGADGLATATWYRDDGSGRLVPRGVYFCRYHTPSAAAVRKVLVAN